VSGAMEASTRSDHGRAFDKLRASREKQYPLRQAQGEPLERACTGRLVWELLYPISGTFVKRICQRRRSECSGRRDRWQMRSGSRCGDYTIELGAGDTSQYEHNLSWSRRA
jgi:hypothetical protein